MSAIIRFCVHNPLITLSLTAILTAWGWFAWTDKTVDAIPDVSENQTIVVTEWPGRSPQDVEDQITYPLASKLAGVKGVKEVRGLSGFGFSHIYVAFEDHARLFSSGLVDDFYEARTRVLEKLSSVARELPTGVVPELGPDATALGQVLWYTVDGPHDLASLRSAQDWVVRYELQTVPGVAEVASVGGMVREYQVDVDPNRLRYYGVRVMDVVRAIQNSNLDVGAKTIEASGMEYVVRGLGFIKGVRDIEEVVVGVAAQGGFVPAAGMGSGMPRMSEAERMDGDSARGAGRPAPTSPVDDEMPHAPIRVRDVADVHIGPAFRRGALIDDSAERVGGVVVMRFGANPREVIAAVHERIALLNDPENGALPEGVRITPFYDRTELIDRTVETLETALLDELWITVAVVLLFLLHLRSALVIAATLPVAVLMSFIAMQQLGVDSNLMSLTGIAIAIGTMVDMGIVMTETIYAGLQENRGRRPAAEVVSEAAAEVAPALATAIATTVITFLPILFLTDTEGKLFRPLAWTKTFALAAAAITGVLVVPVLCRLLLPDRQTSGDASSLRRWVLRLAPPLLALPFAVIAAHRHWLHLQPWIAAPLAFAVVWWVVARLTRERLVAIDDNPVSHAVHRAYDATLRWILAHKRTFLTGPLLIVLFGVLVTVGGAAFTAPLRALFGPSVDRLRPVAWLTETFPGLGQEFMPPLDEGTLLYMPSLLPQAGLSEVLDVARRQNEAMTTVPEVKRTVAKLGRTAGALDPAPIGMLETVVELEPKDKWRPGLTKSDLVRELTGVVHTPGVSEGAGAWLQPIETRVLMLNSDIRAPLAVRLLGAPRGDDGRPLDTKAAVARLEQVAGRIRDVIRDVPGVAGPNVENIGAKPYIEFEIHRERVGHYGLTLGDVQQAITTAVGGMEITRTLEGRERYPIRVAYARELRDRIEAIDSVLVAGAAGVQVPISEVATIREVTGPAAVKTQDGRIRLHVTFGTSGRDEGGVMEDVLARVEEWRRDEQAAGRVDPIPAGVSVLPAGRYESQLRARERFAVILPVCLLAIVYLLYLNFRRFGTVLNVFAAAPVVVAGGLILIWAYPHLWDLAHELGLTDAPSDGPIHITVAVVVGFIALLGIATDDGVVIATYLEQSFRKAPIRDGIAEIRDRVVTAGLRRARPCLMTTMTTIIALVPILLSSGTGSDVAKPMAIPVVGGMLVELISLFVVPCVYCWGQELRWKVVGRDG